MNRRRTALASKAAPTVERDVDTDIDLTPPEQRVHPWRLRVRSTQADVSVVVTIQQSRAPGMVNVNAELSSNHLGKHGDIYDVFDCTEVRFDVLEEFSGALALAVATTHKDHPKLAQQAALRAIGADDRDILATTQTSEGDSP